MRHGGGHAARNGDKHLYHVRPIDGLKPPVPRITDLSSLTPENIKYRNTEFLQDRNHPYELGWGLPDEELRRKAWNARNGDLRRVMREFPTDEPLRHQGAHWMHALIGKHFFPDANHRTAAATLRRLLWTNEIYHDEWSSERLVTARKQSHEVRQEIENRDDIVGIRMDTLYRKDDLFSVWLSFFEDQLDVYEP